MNEENFVERVRKAAELAGGQLALSQKTGISARTINAYALGESEPSRSRLVAIADAAGVSAGWLVNGEGPMLTEENTPPQKETSRQPEPQSCVVDATGRVAVPRWQDPDPEMFDYIPMIEAHLSAGGGCFVISEEVEGYYAFRKSWLSRVASGIKNLVLMRVHGDSMSPTLQDGDTVMIDTGCLSIKEGMMYALRFDSTIMVKRLAFRPGGRIQIISDNRQEYDPFEVETKELHILGQIIFFCRTFVPD
jgi:phage repressor protein C with HTH and peptisase S24 domain